MSNEENPEEYRVKGDAEFTGKKTVVKVNVDKDGIKNEIKQELEREENEKKLIDFMQNLKDELSSRYPEYSSLIDSATSPLELHEILEQARAEKPTEKKPPVTKGKAPMYSPDDSGFESHSQVIDKLYFDGYYNPEADEATKKQARQRIDALFQSLKNSGAWRTLKESGVSGFGKPIVPHMDCAKCHSTIQSYPCKICNYDPKKHEPYLFKSPQDSGMAGVPK